MKRLDVINSIVVLLLVALALLTLTPLFLMFHTSFKPAGTLTKTAQDLRLTIPGRIDGALSIRLNQDVRKFSDISFLLKGARGGEGLEIALYDIHGNSCAVDLIRYLKDGLTKDWQKVSMPIADFDIHTLNLGLPEKVVENIVFRIKGRAGGAFIDKATLKIKRFTASNYIDVLISGHFGRYFFNSFFIALIITIGNIFFCTIVGYGFARKDFAFKNLLFLLVLTGIMIPPQVLLVPIFIMMKNIGWLNTYWALIVPSLVQPFGIFLMKQYISRLPASLEEQARVDGATERQILFRIIFPLSRPALAIIGINTFMGAWNTFLFPFILTNTSQMRTLPVGLALFKNLQGADWVHLMAGSTVTALPVILVFLAFQKHIIAGLTTGLVKR